MRPDYLCRCDGLKKSYGKRPVLAGCTLEVRRGEIVGLVGENGSGKSTLVRCLLGLTPPTAGTIDLQARVGYCPQEPYLNDSWRVSEHLAFAESIYARHGPVRHDQTERLMRRLRLDDYRQHVIRDLSGGTRQKVKFMTSILHEPDLLLMDEPYGGFDWAMYLVFWEIIEEFRAEGAGVLLISHFLYDRERLDRVFELKGGTLDAAG